MRTVYFVISLVRLTIFVRLLFLSLINDVYAILVLNVGSEAHIQVRIVLIHIWLVLVMLLWRLIFLFLCLL